LELILAAPDKGFCAKDVIHKTGGWKLPLWKFIRAVQIASGECADRPCIAVGIGNSGRQQDG
jgi:hypothetical protein